jgi:hypothetical protein
VAKLHLAVHVYLRALAYIPSSLSLWQAKISFHIGVVVVVIRLLSIIQHYSLLGKIKTENRCCFVWISWYIWQSMRVCIYRESKLQRHGPIRLWLHTLCSYVAIHVCTVGHHFHVRPSANAMQCNAMQASQATITDRVSTRHTLTEQCFLFVCLFVCLGGCIYVMLVVHQVHVCMWTSFLSQPASQRTIYIYYCSDYNCQFLVCHSVHV